MAFDLIVWKWKSETTGDLENVLAAISRDDAPEALTRFNMRAFESSLQERFGPVKDKTDGPFCYDVSDFKDVSANWMYISVLWSQVEAVCPEIVEIAHAHGLAVYDPQNERVW